MILPFQVSLALFLPILANAGLPGIDVSAYQGNVDWAGVASRGNKFAYIKATEGTTYKNPYFTQQYNGAYGAGLIRGSYHFAQPASSSGAAQANFFLAHGGGWSSDGKTLPGALDMEYNPSGAACYGLSAPAMVAWVSDFSSTYHAKTGRYPVIYTSTSWWTSCTRNSAVFGNNNPLWVARYASSVGTLPAGWSFQSFWQNSDHGNPGDSDIWNGDAAGLSRFAKGGLNKFEFNYLTYNDAASV
ncbi:glycoside hydrolase family 25 protein [Botryobasidium botryosum FD-172 SS1]|uniref:Lysozyme n=1 Tax=Botryobasidium botryosum (strain FD-172 SS1) TaxID=930990 RepID=A0A067M6S0_BOTB1|nr:glycoside hydrolase family 25 protein [Botryobasidium botryosum FD-172 SS1]